MIINAPSTFRVLWSMVKYLMDARTQAKIEVRGCLHLLPHRAGWWSPHISGLMPCKERKACESVMVGQSRCASRTGVGLERCRDGQHKTRGVLTLFDSMMPPTVVGLPHPAFPSFLPLLAAQVLGTSYQEELLRLVAADNLPQRYGGTCTAPLT